MLVKSLSSQIQVNCYHVPSEYSFRGWWLILFYMRTWGAPLTACHLHIHSFRSIRPFLNNIQSLKTSFNTERQYWNRISKAIDLSTIYYYLNHPYTAKRKALKILKPNMLMCVGLSFVIRFHNNLTNRISKTAKSA